MSAVFGAKGVLDVERLKRELDSSLVLAESVKYERDNLLIRVKGMRDESIDLDILDERVRVVLGCRGVDELVYFCEDGCLRKQFSLYVKHGALFFLDYAVPYPFQSLVFF